MFRFVLRKILNKKWMLLSLLIGNILLVGVAVANPMYSKAILQRTLIRQLGDYFVENNINPGSVMVKNNYYSNNTGKSMNNIKHAEELLAQMIGELNIPSLATVTSYKLNEKAIPDVQIEGEKEEHMIKLFCSSEIEDHINITYGEMYNAEIKDRVIEAIVNERTFVENNLVIGSEFELLGLTEKQEEPYRLKIVGIFESLDEQEPYWETAPSYWSDTYVIDKGLFEKVVIGSEKKLYFSVAWYGVLDYQQMKAKEADRVLEITQRYQEAFKKKNINGFWPYYREILENFVLQAKKLNTTIRVLQIPIFVLLAAFIFMVSRQMLDMEQNEIAVFKSRGASRAQIVKLYILQSLLIALVGIVAGIPLGALICKILGSSNAFLEFVKRTALVVTLDTNVWIFALVVAVFAMGTMVFPVIKATNITIVRSKREKNRKKKRPFWQTIYLDVILLGISCYGLYQFYGQEDYLAQQVLDGASLDPVLYLSSSLFMLGSGLLILRVLPWLIWLVFSLGKRWWSPSAYVSFLKVMRSGQNHGFIVVFLVLTVSMGIFSTRTARTINANNEERINYNVGTDIVLQEQWADNSSAADEDIMGSSIGTEDITYIEPDFGKYTELEGVEKATKVLVEENGSVSLEKGRLNGVQIMGIHTKEFGEVAWFKESLLSVHWYELLNAMSANVGNILVSGNFRDLYGYKVGDVLSYNNKNGDSVRGVISGFVDYWPTYAPYTRTKGMDGIYKQSDHFLIVANLAQLQSAWGITPYQVWIKVKDSTQFIYDYANESGTQFIMFKDRAAELVTQKNDPVFQGTNGILTIGFIIVLLLCAVGFLIYWILSIQSRTLQFGIFRAMGMSGREVLGMLVNEQIFISGTSICGGVLVGHLAAKWFVPLIQIAYSSADRVLPLEIISNSQDYFRLGAMIGLMICVCMIVLGILISRIKITQALKLGED